MFPRPNASTISLPPHPSPPVNWTAPTAANIGSPPPTSTPSPATTTARSTPWPCISWPLVSPLPARIRHHEKIRLPATAGVVVKRLQLCPLQPVFPHVLQQSRQRPLRPTTGFGARQPAGHQPTGRAGAESGDRK